MSEVYLPTADVVDRCVATKPGRQRLVYQLPNVVGDALFASLRPGSPGRGAHAEDVYAADVGPINWRMTLSEVEQAIRPMRAEYSVVFAGNGKQMGRFGPRSTLRILEEAERKHPGTLRSLGFTDLASFVVKTCALDLQLKITPQSVFTHNHPSGSTFLSPEDISLAMRNNVREIRVVTPSGAGMSLQRTGRAWLGRVAGLRDLAIARASTWMTREIVFAGGNPHDAPNTPGFSQERFVQLIAEAFVESASYDRSIKCEIWGPK